MRNHFDTVRLGWMSVRTVLNNSRGDVDMLTLQVGGDVTTSRWALACCSPSLHTYRPASSTRASLTRRSRRLLSVTSTSNLYPSISGILRPSPNSLTRPSSANRTQEALRRSWSEEHLMMTSFPATTTMLRGRVISFVNDGRTTNDSVVTVITTSSCAIVDFIVQQPQHSI